MKGYEDVTRARLTPRMPALIRLDGKAFHTFTRRCVKPFDERFQRCMWDTARYVCERVQGCRLAYVQSDEISLLLVDYEQLNSEGWFDHDIRKMVSVSAAMASVAFGSCWGETINGEIPVFDSRAWSIPREEACNYFVWRQQDAVRNSIQGLAQAYFSAKQIHGLSCPKLQEKLFSEKGINWNDTPTVQKRGACIVRVPRPVMGPVFYEDENGQTRNVWELDLEPPTFTADRTYVERFVYPPKTEEA